MTSFADRDQRVLDLLDRLVEIEQRLIPTGLHVFGQPSAGKERVDMLRMVASFDRPEENARALPDLVAEGLGYSYSALSLKAQSLSEEKLKQREQIEAIVTSAIQSFLNSGVEAASSHLTRSANVEPQSSLPMLELLGKISRELETNTEIESLLRALRDEYIQPGPGADIVQNPGILPTGRNTHAINPYSVPSELAFARAEVVANSLLDRY